jgi:aspartate/methionine/tyrosine aminotransferase
MTDALDRIHRDLEDASPALARLLSPLGRRSLFPPDIPFQAAQARGKRFNGTIGQITDGRGGAVALPSLASGLDALDTGGVLGEAAKNRALLYSPVEGMPEVRRLWRERQRRDAPEGAASTLPLVVDGLTHALSIVADLFAGEGRAVAVAEPFWGNYRQTFATRNGARVLGAPAYRDGRFEPRAWSAALAGLPAGEPAVAILNFPSNPGGYSPTAAERRTVADSLLAEAERRPLLVVCDDAYAGLVYEDAVPRHSMFWDLAGCHPDLVPVKVDGATKELSFFGGRVGFLTFAFEPESPAAAALESKVKFLLRATVGSPVAVSQALVAQALSSPTLEAEIEAVRRLLAGRVEVLRGALAACDPALLAPLPFNSGCFALVELAAAGPEPEALRRHLLDHHDTGLISVRPRFVRIAHCSVDAADLPELVRRLERGAAELASQPVPAATG